jgi:DNA polymerase I-like protein with 3'-5' exonuclease and polymerase domains
VLQQEIIDADYVGFELTLAKDLGKAKTYIDIETRKDYYTEVAKKLFNVEEVTPELRRRAKEAAFVWHYGGWPPGVVR